MEITASIITRDIIFFVQTLVFLNHGIYEAWETRTFDFTPYDSLNGTLIINNAKVQLVMGPFEVFAFATVDTDQNGNFNACVNNVTFPEFNVTFDYIADIGINNEIPIYGNGSYNARLNDIQTTFCWLLASDGEEILDFNIHVLFRHGPVSLTGFYRNEELDPIIGNFLTLAKRLFAMWNNYESECSSKCILNPIFYFMTNYLIYDINKSSELNWKDCSCLNQLAFTFASQLGLEKDNDLDLRDLYNNVNYLVEDVLSGNLLKKLEDILL